MRAELSGREAMDRHLVSGRERFVSYVRRRVGDPEAAEDIVQESLLKALRAAPALEDGERLTSWFYRVLQNAIADHHRRVAADRRRVEGAKLAFEETEEPPDERELCACFEELLPTLKPEYAEVIRTLDLAGELPEAVAARLGVTSGNLKVRRHRARQALRKRLEETCRMCAEGHCLDCDCARTGEPASRRSVTGA